MKTCTVRTIAMGVVLLGTSMGSAGLSLGRLQGAAWIGKPLDVVIRSQMEQGDGVEPDCLQADVFFGDAQIDPSRVAIRFLASPNADKSTRSIQIRSTVLINEPVVGINLIVGCQQKTSRRYTLFADPPTSMVQPAVPSISSLKLEEAAAVVAANRVSALAQAAKVASLSKPSPRKPAAKGPSTDTSNIRLQPARVATPDRQTNKARLKVDPLEFLQEIAPVLRSSDTLLALPQGDGTIRSEAAALWQALNASPETMASEDARAQRLQQSIQSLRSVTTANQKDIAAIAQQAELAESDRYANALVYSLVALCAACILGLGWVWLRLRARRASNWADGFEGGDNLLAELTQRHKDHDEPIVSANSPGASVPGSDPLVQVPAAELDFDLDLLESSEGTLAPVGGIYSPARSASANSVALAKSQAKGGGRGAPGSGFIDFSHSVASGARAIDSEELVDAREKADFFVSIGQTEQAIEILTNRIAHVGESSPLVCLDLLKIYHQLGMRTEFEFMRTEFNNWFAGRVPEFAMFASHGRALDRYPSIMQKIVTLWPTPSVLEYIEACIYQHSEGSEGIVFDLQAYLDLLLLHSVAKRLVRQSVDPLPGASALETVRIPQRAAGASGRGGGDANTGGGSVHRAGAHLRGSNQRSGLDVPDPELAVDTQGAPVAPAETPNHAPESSDPSKPSVLPSKGKSDATDFDFFDLR